MNKFHPDIFQINMKKKSSENFSKIFLNLEVDFFQICELRKNISCEMLSKSKCEKFTNNHISLTYMYTK